MRAGHRKRTRGLGAWQLPYQIVPERIRARTGETRGLRPAALVQPVSWRYSFHSRCGSSSMPRSPPRNKAKNGIDFVEAQELWLDPDRIELPARPTSTRRFSPK